MIKDFPNAMSAVNAYANTVRLTTKDVVVSKLTGKTSHDCLHKIDELTKEMAVELRKRVKETKVLIENGELDKAMEMLDSFLV